MLEEIVHPGALDSRAQIAEDLHEMKEQLRKQVARLRELRIKKVEEPGTLFFLDTALESYHLNANFRCLLRPGGHGPAQRRRYDGCLDGSDYIHAIYRSAFRHVQDVV